MLTLETSILFFFLYCYFILEQNVVERIKFTNEMFINLFIKKKNVYEFA